MEYSREQLMSMYKALPDDLKEALYGVETTQTIQNVARSYGLHVDQMGELANAIGQVMLGALHPRDFTKRIRAELGIDEQKASALTREVNMTVFGKIRESLKRIHALREDAAFDMALVGGIPDRETLLRDIEEPPKAVANKQPARTTDVVQSGGPTTNDQPKPAPSFEKSVEPLLHIPRKVETNTAPAPTTVAPDPYREPLK